MVLTLLESLVGLTSIVLLMLSLRTVGRFVGAFAAAGNATTTLVIFGIFYAIQLFFVIAPIEVLVSLGQGLLTVIVRAIPILGIIALIFFMYAVNGVRTAIMLGAIEDDIY